MDKIGMSLDDIIKKNKNKGGRDKGMKKGPIKSGKILKKGKGGFVKKANLPTKKNAPNKITDARLKLIKKNRIAIRDAREKIAENQRSSIKDARELLASKKKNVAVSASKSVLRKAKIPRYRSPKLSMDEELLMDDDNDMDIDDFKTKPLTSLRRTVQNDIFRQRPAITPPRMPKLPTFTIPNREPSPIMPDPFDCYNVPTRRPVPPPPIPRAEARFQPGRIMSAHMDAYDLPRRSILRTSRVDDHDDRFENDRYLSGASRNHYAGNDSAGIFANTSLRRPSPPPMPSHSHHSGYRIVISNLEDTITDGEIRELFEDVGPLISSKMIRQGIAEVIYHNEGDAEVAVETYHNRQLDGRPMKLTLAPVSSYAKGPQYR